MSANIWQGIAERSLDMLIAKYDDKGVIFFEAYRPKPFDTRRLQSAMFMNRADLWQKPLNKRAKPVPKEQMKMFSNPSELHLNFLVAPACKV